MVAKGLQMQKCKICAQGKIINSQAIVQNIQKRKQMET